MVDDAQLLQRYATSHSGDAFAELVRRHMPLVYAAALRQVQGAVHRAEDVTQTVFIELARNARSLSHRTEIVGWLYTTTHHTAAKLKRSEQRRQHRELEARIMQEDSGPSSEEIEWERLRPVLDETMLELSHGERDVILMRFFQARPFADVGRNLGLTEDAARMRVERALDKLRVGLARRDITSTTAALALALANQPMVTASTTLAASVVEAVLTGAGPAAGAGLWTTLMSMTKLQVGISGTLAVAVVTGFVLQAQNNAELRAEAARIRAENAAITAVRDENRQLARTMAEVAEMRRDDAELARLNDEAAALKVRLDHVARAEEQALAARSTDLSRLDRTPSPRHQVRPNYPEALRTMGVDGEVLVDFVVDASGKVREARAMRTSLRGEKNGDSEVAGERVRLVAFTVAATPPDRARRETSGASAPDNAITEAQILQEMEAAAIAAVSQWQFEAGRKGGREVSTRMTVPMVFTLASPENPPGAPVLSAAVPGP